MLTAMELAHRFGLLRSYVESRQFAGYCKFDALNSPLLEALFGFSPISRLLVTQAVNRIPLPLRAIFGVRKARNPKGIANFVKGYATLYAVSGEGEYLAKATELADWLLGHHSAKYGRGPRHGIGWGYHFPWQSPGFFAPRHAPNCIVTLFCAEALLQMYSLTKDARYRDAALGAKEYIQKELPILEETEAGKCIGYVADGPKWKVININAVAAGFLSKCAAAGLDADALVDARKMITWVLAVRTPENTWNYTEPKSQSGIGPDNYHTGGILDGILDYLLVSGDREFENAYAAALEVYRSRFFTEEGAPRWRLHKEFPQDIHGAAQGILTFSRASKLDPRYLADADRIAAWAMKHMQDEKTGTFYYQRFRWFTWKQDLMRWNNSWMFWALAEWEQAKRKPVHS